MECGRGMGRSLEEEGSESEEERKSMEGGMESGRKIGSSLGGMGSARRDFDERWMGSGRRMGCRHGTTIAFYAMDHLRCSSLSARAHCFN